MEMHPATLWEAISDTVPERLAVIQGPVRRTWREFETASARLAGALARPRRRRQATRSGSSSTTAPSSSRRTSPR